MSESIVVRGSCYWFATNNKSGYSIRKCRNGSLCRFLHLTGDECSLIATSGHTLVECRSCEWKKIPISSDLTGFELFQEQARRKIPCMGRCRDGKLTLTRQLMNEARRRDMCECSEKMKSEVGSYCYRGDHPRSLEYVDVCNGCRGIVNITSR